MFKDLNWLRLTPDRDGRGGTKTGFHSFQQTPINDVRQLSNFHVYKGTWRRDFDTTGYPTPQFWDIGATACPAVHGYVYPSLIDPAAAPSIKIIGQTLSPTLSRFWDFSSGTVRSLRPVQPTIPQAAVFKNINQRCFGGDGLAEAVIMDDRIPAIHAQANQPLGVQAPTQALPNTFIPQPYGTGYWYYGSRYLNHPNPNNMLGTIDVTDAVSISFPNSNLGQYTGGLPAALTPVLVTTSNVVPFAATGTISIDPAVDPTLVTLTGATWPAGFQYCGLSINFNGYSFVIMSHGSDPTTFTLDGGPRALSNVQLLILGVYTGPKLTNIPYTITGCQVTFNAAPGDTPPGTTSAVKMINTGVQGYSQTTNSNLVQMLVLAIRANTYFRNLGNINLGPAGGGVPDTTTDCTLSFQDISSASNPWVSTDVGKTIVLDHGGDLTGTTMLVTTISTITNPGAGGVTNFSPYPTPLTSIRAWWVTQATGCQDAVMASNSPTITSASNPWTINDVGKEIIVAQAGAAGHGSNDCLFGTIITFNNAGSVTLSVNCNATGITAKQAYWGGALSNTHTGPTYAYAWYDPETGHCSNISPLFQVPRPTTQGSFPDFAHLTPTFQIDPGMLSYPNGASSSVVNAGTDGARFSHIIFFRTLSASGSSTLYPIGSLQPYVGKVHPGGASTRGSWNPSPYHGWMGIPCNYTPTPPPSGSPNYWYDFSSDEDLILAGGIRAPQFTNSKPMALLRGGITQPGYPYQIQYWDRRCWIVNTQEPDKIVFSCDDAQCPLGIPEESYPPTNFLRLPAEDGQVTGMRTVGDVLLITTQRFAYIVAGNNESNYRLMKVSSSMPGVGTYQMSEFPTNTGAEGEPPTLFFLGRDRILYQWTLGGGMSAISSAVQDQFDTALSGLNPMALYKQARIHCVSAWGRRLVVCSIAPIGQNVLVYDIDNKIWNSTGISDGAQTPIQPSFLSNPIAMTTVYGGSVPVNEIYTVYSPNILNIIVRSWMRDDTVTALYNPYLSTFPVQFDGKKTRKQICMVNIHATAGTWRLITIVNESSTVFSTAPFVPYPNSLYSIYGPVPNPVDGATVQDSVVMTAQFNSDGMPIIGYRFTFTIDKLDNVPGQIFAIDIGYKDVESPGDGDA